MTSYRTGISPHRRAATRFVARVHRTLQKAYEHRKPQGVTQTSIAQELGVHRSVVNRQLNGREDMSVGRIGEYAWVLGCDIDFDFVPKVGVAKSNQPAPVIPAASLGSRGSMAVNVTLSNQVSAASSVAFKIKVPEHV